MKKRIFAFALFTILTPISAFSDIIMEPEEVQIIHLRQIPAHLYIGNHNIADIDIINDTTLMLKANAFGETKLLAMDQKGNLIKEENILVENKAKPRTLALYLGTNKQTYSCIKKCAAYPSLSDSSKYITDTYKTIKAYSKNRNLEQGKNQDKMLSLEKQGQEK